MESHGFNVLGAFSETLRALARRQIEAAHSSIETLKR